MSTITKNKIYGTVLYWSSPTQKETIFQFIFKKQTQQSVFLIIKSEAETPHAMQGQCFTVSEVRDTPVRYLHAQSLPMELVDNRHDLSGPPREK